MREQSRNRTNARHLERGFRVERRQDARQPSRKHRLARSGWTAEQQVVPACRRDLERDHVIVFGADHIYRMDPRQMLAQHIESGAGATVAGIRVPIEEAHQFGVIETSADGRHVQGFREKPSDPVGLPDAPDLVFASMGNYVFRTKTLIEAVTRDSGDASSKHDVGGNSMPMLVEAAEVCVYDFADNEVPGASARDRGYWRDVGTLDSYYDAHMDMISVEPVFNLYNLDWPILTSYPPYPPAKFVHSEPGRTGVAIESMVCPGVIVSGGTVRRSVLSPSVTVHSHAEVEGSVLTQGVDVGRRAVVRNAIVDKNVQIPAGARIGVDPDDDRARFTVSANGIVVIGKGQNVESPQPAPLGKGLRS